MPVVNSVEECGVCFPIDGIGGAAPGNHDEGKCPLSFAVTWLSMFLFVQTDPADLYSFMYFEELHDGGTTSSYCQRNS